MTGQSGRPMSARDWLMLVALATCFSGSFFFNRVALTDLQPLGIGSHEAIIGGHRCAGCAEPFCGDCLVDIQGQKYCGACKIMALKGAPPPVAEEATIPCKEAGEALTFAVAVGGPAKGLGWYARR